MSNLSISWDFPHYYGSPASTCSTVKSKNVKRLEMSSGAKAKPGEGRGRGRGCGKSRGQPSRASARPGTKPDSVPVSSQPPSLIPGGAQQQSNTPPIQRQSSTTKPTAIAITPQKHMPSKHKQDFPVPSLILAESTPTPKLKGLPQKKPSSISSQTPPNTVSLATREGTATVLPKRTPPLASTAERISKDGAYSSQPSLPITSSQLPPPLKPKDHGIRKEHPPNRPGFGTKGRQIMVQANFFSVQLPRYLSIYHYDMSILPPSKYPKWMCRRIFQAMEKQYSSSDLEGQKCAFDGNKNVYCHKALTSVEGKRQLPVELLIEGETTMRTLTVCLKYVNGMHIDMERMEKTFKDVTQRMSLIQALDIIMRHLPSFRMEPVGRSFFSRPTYPCNLGQGLEVWSGYYQSLRPTMGWKFKLNLDTSSTAFYIKQSVIDFMCTLFRGGRDSTRDLSNEDRRTLTRGELRDYDRKRFDKEIKGLKKGFLSAKV